jgi:TetR/AcrR family transcriptional repressor of mexJK operon
MMAAHRLFTSETFDVVTMEAVAALAGVSKMTVYSHFHDKETLFETIVANTADQMFGTLSGPDSSDEGLRERLVAVGTAFLELVLGPDVCRMAHTLPGTLRANPGLAVRFYAAGPGRVRGTLAQIIAAAAERGELEVDDAALAADDLVSLWEGGIPTKIAYGLVDVIAAEEVGRRARRGTEVFLRAYRRGG